MVNFEIQRCRTHRCPQHKVEENDIHILLKYKETQKWREQFFNSKWLHINEELALKKTVSCAKITELKILLVNFCTEEM